MIDPGDDVTRAAPRARARGRALRRDPRHAHALRPHRRHRRPGRGERRPGLGLRRRGVRARAAGRRLRRATACTSGRGSQSAACRATRQFELAGIDWQTVPVPGHSPGHLAFAADGALFSGDVLFAGLGRPRRPARRRLGDAAPLDPEARRALPARDGRLLRPWAADDARRGARSAIRSSPSCGPLGEVRGAPRNARHPSGRAAALAVGAVGDGDASARSTATAGSTRRRSRTPS